MANPQLEDGYTQIANEILEQLARCRLSPNQWQVLLFIIRKTYGYHKKVDYIANFQIVNSTGLCKAVVSRALHNLAERQLITRNKKHIGLQKDWELWQKLAKRSTLTTKLAEQSAKLAEQSTKVSNPRVTQKKKENNQKKDTSIQNINIRIIYKKDGSVDEQNTIIHHQSLWKIKQILCGKIPASETNRKRYRRELERLGISFET